MSFEVSSDPVLKQLLAQLEIAQRKLVETGTRNRLIHVNRNGTRSNVVNIVNECSDDVFRILKTDRKKMKFWATGTDKKGRDSKEFGEENGQLILIERISEFDGEPDESRYTDECLETKLGPDGQQKRLLKMFRDAKTAEEEQGINILYLALGFLRWFEDANSEVEREAPLILLPVDLVRNQRTSTYDLAIRDDEIVTNLPLREKFNREFGLHLPEIEDTEGEEWTPSSYFDLVEDAISSKDRWSIDRDGIQLGFFSFAKLLMLRDLDHENWPTGKLLRSELLSAILNSTFESDSPLFGDEDNLDDKLDPGEMFHVLDADRSQAIVIEEIRKGRNLVVQGPPGTGKSQTITNIIASAVHDGKKVLFVAEKMAALSVVQRNLREKAGLRHIALELHSKAANKRQVLEELGRTLNEGAAVAGTLDNPESVRVPRDRLNAIVKLLHSPVENCALSPFRAIALMSAMKGKGVPAPSVDGSKLAALSDDRVEALCADITAFGQLLATDKTSSENPFRGTGNSGLQPLDLERFSIEARQVGELAAKLGEIAGRFCTVLGVSNHSIASAKLTRQAMEHASKAPTNAGEMVPILFDATENQSFLSAIDCALAWDDARKENPFVEAALSLPVGELRAALGVGVGSFFRRLGSRYRSASKLLATLIKIELPKAAVERVSLVDRLIEFQNLNERFRQYQTVLQNQLGKLWSGEGTDYEAVREAATFIEEFKRIAHAAPAKTVEFFAVNSSKISPIASNIGWLTEQLQTRLQSAADLLKLDFSEAFDNSAIENAPLSDIAARLEKMSTEPHRYDSWRSYRELRSVLAGHHLEQLVSRMVHEAMTHEAASNEVKYARAESAWRISREAEPALNGIGDVSRHELVEQFMGAERNRMKIVRKVVASSQLKRVPTGAIGEMGFVRSQISRKIGHKPIRTLMRTAGSVIQRIRPVFLMSPISVAQFLPPESVEFDILVIDEASQVKPEDAFGAIARSKQIVIVGDQKQLPPTTFFDKMTSNADDDDDDESPLAGYATEAESILSLCHSRQLPSRMLSWHYRSRDPSLIKVSNIEFYEHKLVLPPSPLEKDADYGLRFIRVNGVYTPKSGVEGKPGTNLIEAEGLVEAVKVHARTAPDLSLGIATFNIAQRDCVNEVLERERRNDEVLDDFLREGGIEDVFVKNIENVQGDERDVIMISVGYGPRIAGQRLASTNFGPVNKEGGHRRLNVLFSRARVRCDVFCSFDPGDIAVDGKSDGVRVFKRYLEFAKTGKIDEATATGGLPDSPFESDVANYVRDLGYSVDHQVGSGGFLIDLGVIHPKRPGQYMLAVECDGATYHSALWSRERDRLRQEVLEHLGWRFHRIWSTDWFFRREKEKERLRQALEAAAKESNPGASITGANKGAVRTDKATGVRSRTSVESVVLQPAKSTAIPYQRAVVRGDANTEPYLASDATARRIVGEIIMQEGPIHEDEVARRFAEAFYRQKAGSRIVSKTNETLRRLKGHGLNPSIIDSVLINDGKFWMTVLQKRNPRIRNRSSEIGNPLYKAEMLPPIEIHHAASNITSESGSVDLDELVRHIAREFGYERTGPELRSVIEQEARKFAKEI